MSGRLLLSRIGKQVLRPGEVELTEWLIDASDIRPSDRALERLPGRASRCAACRRALKSPGWLMPPRWCPVGEELTMPSEQRKREIVAERWRLARRELDFY